MSTAASAALSAALAVLLTVGTAMAGPAIIHRDTIVRELPKEESAHIWDLVAGMHVDVIGCNPAQWCKIARRGQVGWIHETELDLTPHRETASVATTGGNEVPSLSDPGNPGGSPTPPAQCCAAAIDEVPVNHPNGD